MQQQQQMIGLLTYLIALMMASIANDAVVFNLENLQSRYRFFYIYFMCLYLPFLSVDYFDLLSSQKLANKDVVGYVNDFKNDLLGSKGINIVLFFVFEFY